MDANQLKAVYFIGAGGIGMSALVRYFLSKGKKVGGYDRTPSELTEKLIEEGAQIHYEESVEQIAQDFLNAEETLIVYTPAIPDNHAELQYFRQNGFTIHKRSQVLGMLTRWSGTCAWLGGCSCQDSAYRFCRLGYARSFCGYPFLSDSWCGNRGTLRL